jgi:hypothetical protein
MMSDLFRSSRSLAGMALLFLSLLVSVRSAHACTADTDCKGDRICERGACEDPSAVNNASTPPAGAAETAFARLRTACTAGAIAHAGEPSDHRHPSRHTSTHSGRTP